MDMRWTAVAMGTLLVGQLGCVEEAPAPRMPEPAAPTVEVVRQQEVLTPLPLRVRLPSRYGANKVLVFFHTWGSRDWGMLELARAGQTWTGEVSCREVSTVTGDTRYFFLALDANGGTVGGSGSPDWPHVATIVGKLNEGAQGLSGQSAPIRCVDPADCPPDFPGCPAYAVRRPACHADRECDDGSRCAWDGYCLAPEPAPDAFVSDDARLAAAVKRAVTRYGLDARK
jgi:hypothetical protein